VNIAARPNLTARTLLILVRKEQNLDRPNGEMCAELLKHALRQAQGADERLGAHIRLRAHMTGSGRM
jgi:hypothetical protein